MSATFKWKFEPCKHFAGEKSLSIFVQNKKEFIEPQERIIGFDPDTEKTALFSMSLF